ncbi:MAG: hypothetical protein SF051_05645 [Elusimicrobiota bacterium]|nr:hypothetical protein [Elusimicrobiota bacterium]
MSSASRPGAVPGSFRDPAGFVFREGRAVHRALTREGASAFRALAASGLLERLTASGAVAATEEVPADARAPLDARFPGTEAFLSHREVPWLVEPCEWTFEMLREAALLHLEVLERSRREGFTLLDASAYNVQFVRGRPLLIDTSALAPDPDPSLWPAYGRFCRHFVYPLLLGSAGLADPAEYFLPHLDGLDPRAVARRLGWGSLRPRAFFDVFLQAASQSRAAADPEALAAALAGRGPAAREGGAAFQGLNLRRLRRLVEGLRPPRRAPAWAEHDPRDAHPAAALEWKRGRVERFVAEARPATLVDLGCRVGEHSLPAAAAGASVACVDADPAALERLRAGARASGADATCLRVDLLSPTPALGVGAAERPGFFARVRGDAALALGLAHHLLSSGMPVDAFAGLLDAVAARRLLVEFVPPEDPLFARLSALRRPAGVGRGVFLAAFEGRFRMLREEPVPGGGRVLFTFERA